MDHLPLPVDPSLPILRAPYICGDEVYDGGLFEEYPERAGFGSLFRTDGHIRDDIDRDNAFEVDGMQVFLQRWLFFGLLHEMFQSSFAAADWLVDDDDKIFVQTEQLIPKLRDWVLAVEAPDEQEQEAVLARLWKCLSLAGETLRRFTRRPEEDFNTGILLSLFVLRDTIESTIRQAFPSQAVVLEYVGKPSLPFQDCYYQMAANGWCPYEMKLLMSRLSLPRYYFIRHLKRPMLYSHDLCDETRCTHAQVDKDTYQTRHVNPSCQCGFAGPSMRDISRCLDDGSFGVLEVVQTNGGVDIKVRAFSSLQDDEGYIAISHVWADGLGNVNAMELPCCQLKRLQHLVESINQIKQLADIQSDGVIRRMPKKLYLWCDTICCPVDGSISPDRHLSYQQLTLGKMKEIYGNASAVLVVHSAVANLEIARHGRLEILEQILTCSWMHRLWTLQEARLAHRLLIQCADPVPHDLRILAAEVSLERNSYSHDQSIDDLVEGLLGIKHQGVPEQIKLHLLCVNMMNRRVSQQEDEPLCLATYVGGLDLTQIAKSKDAEGRMAAFWKLYATKHGGLPQSLAFSTRPRLTLEGMRWAPSTMCGPNFPRLLDRDKVMPTERGFPIMSPVWHLSRYKFYWVYDLPPKDLDSSYVVGPDGKWYDCTIVTMVGRSAEQSDLSWAICDLMKGDGKPWHLFVDEYRSTEEDDQRCILTVHDNGRTGEDAFLVQGIGTLRLVEPSVALVLDTVIPLCSVLQDSPTETQLDKLVPDAISSVNHRLVEEEYSTMSADEIERFVMLFAYGRIIRSSKGKDESQPRYLA